MSGPLQIPQGGTLDLLALGAMVIRLDPGVVPFNQATTCDIHVSGGEFNVAANLASCFGLRTAVATAMVDNPVGRLVDAQIRARGVAPIYRRYACDNVRGPNIATVYSDRGFGARAPVVFYNRADEAAARLKPGDFDWNGLFRSGIRWFHSGGIFASLSGSTSDLIVEAMEAAHASGAIVSFDLNYRPKLWSVSGGEGRAQAVFNNIVKNVDVLVANEEDIQMGLGIPGPSLTAGSALTPSSFLAMTGRVVDRFPGVRVVATTLRDVRSANRHGWSAIAWMDGEAHLVPTLELDVLDRVGGGDGFAAGFFYGLLSGADADEAVRLGWAHGALVTTYPGDTTMATLDQVRALAAGSTARIQR